MKNLSKVVLSFLAAPALLLTSSQALAITTPPECGNYDFNLNNVDCKIQVAAACNLDCSSLNFQAGCDSECQSQPVPGCVDPCDAECQSTCDPATLDCVGGCMKECEQPFIDQCKIDHPERDCVTDAKASCKSQCRTSCTMGASSNCQEACTTCCGGSCTSYANMACDINCYAKLEGGCKAQCSADGALMCKDVDGVYQFVNASDVSACVNALITQGLKIDVSARGEVTCNLSGCNGVGDATVGGLGCSAMPGQTSPFAAGALVIAALGAGISVARRRSRRDDE